jgi:hypothetical protein
MEDEDLIPDEDLFSNNEEEEVRRKRRGLTKKEMRMIGCQQLSERLIRELELSECSICFGPFKPREFVRNMCGGRQHCHAKCIDAWFKTHESCPLCRENVMERDNLCVKLS